MAHGDTLEKPPPSSGEKKAASTPAAPENKGGEEVAVLEDANHGTTTPGGGFPARSSAEAIEFLEKNGYVIAREALDPRVCDELAAHASFSIDEARAAGREEMFGKIQEPEKRHDLKLRPQGCVLEALNQVLGGEFAQLFASAVGSEASLVELAVISSDPGAKAQPVHADTVHGLVRYLHGEVEIGRQREAGRQVAEEEEDEEDFDEDAEAVAEVMKTVATNTASLYTMLLALQDITSEMGPTLVWPGTNTVEHHTTFWNTNLGNRLEVREADTSFGVPKREMLLKKGDLVFYDSRTMHCGGANISSLRRSVLCLTLMGEGIKPEGSTYTMLQSLRNKFRLSSFPLIVADSTEEQGEKALDSKPVDDQGVDAAKNFVGQQLCVVDEKSRAQDTVPVGEAAPVPPLTEWRAAVQCTDCGKWRPCAAEEAAALTLGSGDRGRYHCSFGRFSCETPQKYSTDEVNAWLESED